MTDDIDNDGTTLYESGGVVQPTDAQIAPLDDLHGLLFLAQRTEGEQREAAISNARIVLHKFREAMVAIPQAPLQAEPVPVVASEPVAQVSEIDGKKCVTFYSHKALYETPLWTKLYAAANYIDVLGGNSQTYREALATPQAEPAVAEQARDGKDWVDELPYGEGMPAMKAAIRAALASQSTPPPESAGQELSDAEIDSMLCEINKWCAEYPLDADVGLPLLDATASDELRAIVRDAILAANRTANHE